MFTQRIPEARSDMIGQSISDSGDVFPPEVREVMKLCWKRDHKERAMIGEIIVKLFQ